MAASSHVTKCSSGLSHNLLHPAQTYRVCPQAFKLSLPFKPLLLPTSHHQNRLQSPRSLLPAQEIALLAPVQQRQLAQLATPAELFTVSEGLETPIQLIYLIALLGFLSAGAYLVVRQVLIRRELDEAAKQLGERIRTNEATCEDYFELGVILTRKKLYTQATKNLEKAKKVWDGEESELAQVHNALGFCYFSMDRTDLAVAEYKKAVELQPGYVTAWNNLGDAYEKERKWKDALAAYQEALSYAPNNKIAMQRSDYCKNRVVNLGMQ